MARSTRQKDLVDFGIVSSSYSDQGISEVSQLRYRNGLMILLLKLYLCRMHMYNNRKASLEGAAI